MLHNLTNVEFIHNIEHMGQPQARGPNLARSAIIFGPRDFVVVVVGL